LWSEYALHQLTVTLAKPWHDFLKEIDDCLSQPASLTCIGAFVLAALHGLPRPTGDLDYIEVIPLEAADEIEAIGGRASAFAKKYRFCFRASKALPICR
jgi:hypothetical protein